MNKTDQPHRLSTYFTRTVYLLAAGWVLAIVLGMGWTLLKIQENTLESARIQASYSFEKDLVYRRWAAEHGGVYVPMTGKTPPTPYLSHLSHRDVKTSLGQELTLVNPAYMTRQVHQLGYKQYGFQGHITSLNPLRPENKPDPWEAKALQTFKHGQSEVAALATIEGEEYLRLMRPMITEKSCLKCHAHQGYTVGDIRGGISVSVPMAPLRAAMHTQILSTAMAYVCIWLLGLGGIFFGATRMAQRIREQDMMQATLQKTLKEYNDLYNSVPDMLFSMDATDGRILSCNQTLLDNLNYTRDEVIHQQAFDVFHSTSGTEPFSVSNRYEGSNHKEILLQRKDGSELPVSINVSAVRNKKGNTIQSSVVMHDISDSKRMEKQILIAEKMSTIAGLAAGVAHEINTPLSGILQATQLIQMGLDPAEKQNMVPAADFGIDLVKLQKYLQDQELDFFLEGIQKSATRAAAIISDLLKFSRPQESVLVQADLTELIDRSIELARTDYSLKKEYNIHNVTFIREYGPDLSPMTCRTMEIEQVLIQLIRNSCQAMAEEPSEKTPQILLRAKQHGQQTVLEVEDNGPGIEDGVSRHIFDPFFTTKEVGKGTGLGLAVAYTIITDRHGGSIQATSLPEGGTLFSIVLPMETSKLK